MLLPPRQFRFRPAARDSLGHGTAQAAARAGSVRLWLSLGPAPQKLTVLTSDASFDYIRCMRTTLDLDKPVLEGLKALQKKQKRSLSRIASELLADALNARRKAEKGHVTFSWNSSAMRARVDLQDKEAVYKILDEA